MTANNNEQLYDIKVGDYIYYLDLYNYQVESKQVVRINHGTEFQGNQGDLVTVANGDNFYFSTFNKLWFHDSVKAEAALRRMLNRKVLFGDTVKFVAQPEKGYGVVSDVSFQFDVDSEEITARYEVSLEHDRIRSVRESDLERLGNAFADIPELVNARVLSLKNALLNILLDSPRYKKKQRINKKELIHLIEVTEQ